MGTETSTAMMGGNAEPGAGENTGRKPGFGKIFGGDKKKTDKEKDGSGRNSRDDIKKLTRTELLELLIDETKEADRLRAENDRLSRELQKCHDDIDRIVSFEAVIARLEAIVNGK